MALKLLLTFRGMSQEDLSRRTGIHSSQISRYVNGKVPLPSKHRGSILQVLELTSRAWGQMEEAALRVEIESRRFEHRSASEPQFIGKETESETRDPAQSSGAAGDPGRDSETQSEAREVTKVQRPVIDPEAADDLAALAGVTVETLAQRFLDLFTEQKR